VNLKKQADNGQKPLGMEEDYWNSRSTTDWSTLDEQEDHQMNQATISKPEWFLKILQICNSFVSYAEDLTWNDGGNYCIKTNQLLVQVLNQFISTSSILMETSVSSKMFVNQLLHYIASQPRR